MIPRPVLRRGVLSVFALGIVAFATSATIAQRRSIDDAAAARTAVRAALDRYAGALRRAEPRAAALTALRNAGADVRDQRAGDIVITVVHALRASARCRSVIGQLHVEIDARERVAGWETPVNAECD